MRSLDLQGKRILVTRARHQAGRLAEALEALGAEVLQMPTIEIIPPESYAPFDAALQAINDVDWLILTSANAVAAVADRLRVLGIPRQRLQHLQVAAVGNATAVAVGAMGLKVSAMPEEYVAEALVAMLRDKASGKRVLLARAAVARDVIPDELRQCGADVQVVDVYRTVIPEGSVRQVRELFRSGNRLPDAVTFTSSSTVTNFLALLAAAQLQLPQGLRAVSIGPVTTSTLRKHNWEPAQQAVTYDIPGLVNACVRLLG